MLALGSTECQQRKMDQNITKRQAEIIRSVVSEYVTSGQPVGSAMIVDKLIHDVSSATIRKEMSILEESKDIFKSMWFDFEIMSNNIIILNWVPDFIKKENLKKVFLWILEDIWEEHFDKSKTLDEIKNKIFAYTACRSAIKFWNKLNLFEMNKLLNDSAIDYSMTCPHGRPVLFEIWLDDLKRKYER